MVAAPGSAPNRGKEVEGGVCRPSLVSRPSYHGVPVRGPGNNGLRMRLIKTARYA